MKQRYYNEAIECAPIDVLIQNIEEKLSSTDVFVRAAASPLYREKWQEAGIDPSSLKSYADLRKLPYTNSSYLRDVQVTCHPDEFICSQEKPRYWNSTSGSTGTPKWVPVGGTDRVDIVNVGYRLAYFPDMHPIVEDDVAFGITAPAPFISDSGTWSGFVDELRGVNPQDTAQIETVLFSYEDGIAGIGMAIKRKISVFAAFPSLAMLISEGFTNNAKSLAEENFKKEKNFLNTLAYLITRVKTIKARDLIKVHTGLFGGEPLAPYRDALYDAWNLKYSYNLYTSTEFRIGFLECSAQDGMHVWLDACVPEIILQKELDREREEDGYIPEATPLWEAKPGDEGELVVTTYLQTFPLLRWRTSDSIQIVSTEKCTCGRTHPRINIKQRSDDLVNLGVIRFSTFAVQNVLEKIDLPAQVSRWQLRVSRKDYKPMLTVLVKPDNHVDEDVMAVTVKGALEQIEALKLGWENGLVLDPKIIIDYDLDRLQSSSGKFRPLVYEVEQEEVG